MAIYLKLVILIVFLAILLFAGIKFLYHPVNAIDLLNEIYEKAARAGKYSLTYSISVTSESDSISSTTKGQADVILIDGKLKTTLTFTPPKVYQEIYPYYPSEKTEFEYYLIPEGEIMCSKISIIYPKYDCREVESTETISEWGVVPQAQMNLLKEWKDKNILNISYLGKRKIIDRECDNFRFDVNIEKLMDYMKAGVSIKEGTTNYTIISCFDRELGVSLYLFAHLTVNYSYRTYSSKYGMKAEFEATKLSRDVGGITDINLPVPLNEVKWLPKFSVVESACEANSKEVKVAIKAKRDVPAGNAIINMSSSERKTFYPNAEVTGYNHYCFSLSDITSGSSLSFSFREINDTYLRQFIIGIDCPEVNNQRVYPSYFNECENCKQGKYCSMGTYSYSYYTFTSDLPGTHEVCVWPTSEKGYAWRLSSITIQKRMKLLAEAKFDGMKKDEIKILNFTLSSPLKENEYYSIYLYINGLSGYFYCSTYKYERIPFTGLFTKIFEKIMNVTSG